MDRTRASGFAAAVASLGVMAAGWSPAPLGGQGRPVTVDDLMGLASIVDVESSPDGGSVAYAVSRPSIEANRHEVALFVVPAGGGEPRRVGEGVRVLDTPLPAPRLRWSPDGRELAVLALAGERPQVVAIPVAGGEARQLTAAAEGVSAFEWSPDGASLAYLTRDPLPEEEARRRSLVVEAGAPERPARLTVRVLESGEPRAVSPTAHFVDAFAWSPDGRELAYSAAPRGGFTAGYETRIYAVPAAGGEPRTVVDRPGMNRGPRYSSDGRSIAFITTDGSFDIMAPRSLAVVPAAGGEPRRFPLDDAWVSEYAWAPDGRSLYLLGNDGAFGQRERMFESPVLRLRVEDGRVERLTSGAKVHYALSLSADGRRLAHRAVEGRTMGEVAVLDPATGRSTTLTEVNPELRDLALGELSPVSWSSFDGMEIWGLLLTPPGWSPGGPPVPLLVYAHGGPGGGVTHGLFPQFMHAVGQVDPYPTEAMTAAGFAVLFPMPRGGAGYGEAGQRSIVDAWGEADYEDIMAGVDAMVERGVADPERLGMMGASYGGYMTNWVVTRTGRFRAASAAASIADLTDARLIPDGGEIMTHYFREPWENRESYAAHSPLTFAERVTTPLLLQHGERDPRVPVAGAWKWYRTLAALGKTVELEVYPRGGHVMVEPVLQREVMQRNLEWFLRWIPVSPRAAPSPSPSAPATSSSPTPSADRR